MKIDPRIKVYGDQKIRLKGKLLPSESIEQATSFNWLRINHPIYFRRAVHVKQEGLKSQNEAQKDAMMGLNKGWSDITIAGLPMMLCELKRADYTKGKLSDEQSDLLIDAAGAGVFACVALGHKGFIEAFTEWVGLQNAQR